MPLETLRRKSIWTTGSKNAAAFALLNALLLSSGCEQRTESPTASVRTAPIRAPHKTLSLSPMSEDIRFGVNVSSANDPAWGPAVLGLTRDAGIGWIRLDFRWAEMQGSENASIDTTQVAAAVRYANERGLNILGTIIGSPGWANGGQATTDDYPPLPAKYPAWKSFVDQLVQAFPASRVKYWSIWNEPNDFPHFRADTLVYDTLLTLAATSIHAANAKVAAPEVAIGSTAPVNWLAHVLKKNGSRVDVVTVHFYGASSNITGAMDTLATQVGRRLTTSWTWPLWLTETNVGNTPTEAQQAGALDTIYRHVPPASSHWTKTFWFHLYTTEDGKRLLTNKYDATAAITDSSQIRVTPSFANYRDIANPLSAEISGPTTIDRNTIASFSALASGGAPWGDPSYTYLWTARYGTQVFATGNDATFDVAPPSTGLTFSVRLVVTDGRGTERSILRTISITH